MLSNGLLEMMPEATIRSQLIGPGSLKPFLAPGSVAPPGAAITSAPRRQFSPPSPPAPSPSASAETAAITGARENSDTCPAITTISALTATLMSACVPPAPATAQGCCRVREINCGSSERYMMAILGFARLVIKPIINSLRPLSAGRSRTTKDRAPAGLHRLPGQIKQIDHAADAQRVVSVGNGEDQCGNTERGAQHIKHKPQRHPAGETSPALLPDKSSAKSDRSYSAPGSIPGQGQQARRSAATVSQA